MLKRFFILALLFGAGSLSSGLLVGCGQKGPLYLPSQKNEQAASKPGTVNDDEKKQATDAKGTPAAE
ncbi:LPS translocon maturation chaperone LptM [Alkalimarinus coralli]|uniref:LPS translocon maturation chaperone LptM n=1 Tax=Alkalimarinus coralli TaxID=2935863 RepID=UPI00202B6F63|nr:lipoprotein [Alkalimarinus coralli]